MRAYELMIILDAGVEESNVDACIAQVSENVASNSGEMKAEDRWGKRRFAYEINHQSEGYYLVLEFVTETREMGSLERLLQLADEVVRHKLIRLPDNEAARRGLLGDGTPLAAAG
ncbi:MAG: 30S ribosomal protein S6 [Acidimicrobiia bacterium]|nr:30S ribosomal protein S6 [Acidimicrobiia bacterium]MYG72544.1 30S ribosomal protein S6 [Acidimicrobiia bacterium]